ncbi:MAG: MFS transporter [Planctomycetaceae bacterium]|nr:MFS transporter [Planctomycetaceae bacterium]
MPSPWQPRLSQLVQRFRVFADTTTTVDPERPADGAAALQIPAFRVFLLASLLSNIGNQMRIVAVSWEVYDRARTPLSLGLIGLVLAGPVLLLAMPAGVAADRFSRKGILIGAHLALIACGFGLAFASAQEVPLPWIYLLLLGTGICRAAGWPAMSAMLTQLVPKPLFANAATWRSMAFQTAATLGPVLGAWLLAVTSPAVVYLIDAATSVAFVIALAMIVPAPQTHPKRVGAWQSLLDGVQFVRAQPLILSTITLDMVAVLFGGATALLPVFAVEILDVGPTGYGWLRAMPPVGSILMGLMLTTRVSIHRAGAALLWAVIGFGAWTMAFAVSRSFAVSLVALFMLGAVDNVSVVIRATLLQLLTPDELRGRVSAVNAIFINTSNEIGEFESGITAHWFGPVLAVFGGGVLTLVTVAVVAKVWPSLRHVGRLSELRPEGETETVAAGPPPQDHQSQPSKSLAATG